MSRWSRVVACLTLSCVVGLSAAEATAAPPRGAVAQRKPKTKKKAAPEPAEAAASPEPTPSGGKPGTGTKPEAASNVTGESEDKSGVKTYKFGAQEIEGRTKSPQIAFFLRRVRAEFTAGDLGHRSFLGELRHTRHRAELR